MKKLVVLLALGLMATSAFAAIDPDPNSIGVYFDTAANVVTTSATPSVPFNAYIIITNPTADVSGFECSYQFGAMAGTAFRLASTLPAGSINLGNADDLYAGDYYVGFASPQPQAEAVVVVSWQFLLLVAQNDVTFKIGPSPTPSIDNGLPAVELGGVIAPLGISTGDPTLPCAVVNPVALDVVSTEDTNFGNVKALFR